jgi:hypothetical protein
MTPALLVVLPHRLIQNGLNSRGHSREREREREREGVRARGRKEEQLTTSSV